MRYTDLHIGRYLRLLVLLAAFITITACDRHSGSDAIGNGVEVQPVKASQHRELRKLFKLYNYSWETLDSGVPPLMLNQFPNDLHLIRSPERKKRLFILSLLPMALMANEEIASQRRALLSLLKAYEASGGLDDEQLKQLEGIQADYGVRGNVLTDAKTRATLLRRVDTIPPAMLLAQAANESGWGTSRFAQRANNLFGEWTFTPGQGLVPENRPEGESYEVRRFTTLYQSIQSYARNINTHWAYLSLRQRRERLRAEGKKITGQSLASELDLYSTRRDDYSRDIIGLIRTNRLEQLSDVHLRPSAEPMNTESAEQSGSGLRSSCEQLRAERAYLFEAGRNQG